MPIPSLKTATTYWQLFGARALPYLVRSLLSKKECISRVRTRWTKHPLYVRTRTSDITVFRQCFSRLEYAIANAIQQPIHTIIDAGANIGLTSVYLARTYPEANIYAVEPDQSNFRLLTVNTRAYPNIHCIHGAVWDHDGTVHISNPNAKAYSRQVSNSANATAGTDIRAYCMSTLIEMLAIKRIELLKMDIEGAEYEVLSDASRWIDRVDNIVIELHDSIRPGCSEIFKAVTGDFSIRAVGRELTLACRL